jgi:hypothetical protein
MASNTPLTIEQEVIIKYLIKYLKKKVFPCLDYVYHCIKFQKYVYHRAKEINDKIARRRN